MTLYTPGSAGTCVLLRAGILRGYPHFAQSVLSGKSKVMNSKNPQNVTENNAHSSQCQKKTIANYKTMP
jgi:hypothetical protein